MKREEVIKKLQDDSNYYGKFGKQYLSASDVRALTKRPTEFRVLEKTLPLLMGGYFHTLMLEPEKIKNYPILDVRTRNNKEFNTYMVENNLEQYDILLQKEVDQINRWADKLNSIFAVHELVYSPGAQYEVPEIAEIFGEQWKGKCDILTDDFVLDLKTSSNIHKFQWSCLEYCYDSQAYIYQTLFERPMRFIVIDKSSLEIKIADCSEEFIERGRQKVQHAVKQYKKFFTDDAPDSIDDYIYKEML